MGKMSNHLIHETSPYLLQHAENPVDWYPWGPEALARAKTEQKPIFLSIGYAACHWCHVMAHESFNDPEIARYLNSHFISIKVDREERPDLDSIYMSAVVSLTGQGGWPMSVFLTPECRPFYGGTYFPPEPRYGMPSFSQVIETIARIWEEDRPRVDQISAQLGQHLAAASNIPLSQERIDIKWLDQAVQVLVSTFDVETGGWGTAPKFPQPMVIDFLFTQALRGYENAAKAGIRSLEAMTSGGMYDLIGGGFHRYSTDSVWLVPHFEKMLYDNAQLARAYLHGYQMTGKQHFRQVCEETLAFLMNEMVNPQGGFYSSLDADSPDGEGRYYLWSESEIDAAIGDLLVRRAAKAIYQITPGGNYEGLNIPRKAADLDQISADFHVSRRELDTLMDQARLKMAETRWGRPHPLLDDKVITCWNGLAIWAFSECGAILGRPDYINMAMRTARFLLKNLRLENRLMRSWRSGSAHQPAFLEDYGALVLGLLSLYQATNDPTWFQTASQLVREMLDLFSDESGGFFDTAGDQEPLITRPKDLQDNATPSGNALAALAVLRWSEYTGELKVRRKIESLLASLQAAAARYPSAFAFWLQALDFGVGPVQQVAILGDPKDKNTEEMLHIYFGRYRPRSVFAGSTFPPRDGSPALLTDRNLKENLPTAYICQQFTCRMPVNQPEAFQTELDRIQENPQAGG